MRTLQLSMWLLWLLSFASSMQCAYGYLHSSSFADFNAHNSSNPPMVPGTTRMNSNYIDEMYFVITKWPVNEVKPTFHKYGWNLCHITSYAKFTYIRDHFNDYYPILITKGVVLGAVFSSTANDWVWQRANGTEAAIYTAGYWAGGEPSSNTGCVVMKYDSSTTWELFVESCGSVGAETLICYERDRSFIVPTDAVNHPREIARMNYDNNESRYWYLYLAPECVAPCKVRVIPVYMDIECNSHCSWDYLSVSFAGNGGARYCCSNLDFYWDITSDATIHFYSDYIFPRSGFRLKLTVLHAPTQSITPSVSPTISITPSVSGTISITPSASGTISITPSASGTISITPSASGTISTTPSTSTTPSQSPTSTRTPSQTASRTPSISMSSSLTPSQSASVSPRPFCDACPWWACVDDRCIDPCASSPCGTDGYVCVSDGMVYSSYRCVCEAAVCQKLEELMLGIWGTEPCDGRYPAARCSGHGMCYLNKCQCDSQWTGFLCSQQFPGCEADKDSPMSCLNGGVCNANLGTCECPDSVGARCEIQGTAAAELQAARSSYETAQAEREQTIAVVSVVAVVVLVLIVLLLILWWKRRQHRVAVEKLDASEKEAAGAMVGHHTTAPTPGAPLDYQDTLAALPHVDDLFVPDHTMMRAPVLEPLPGAVSGPQWEDAADKDDSYLRQTSAAKWNTGMLAAAGVASKLAHKHKKKKKHKKHKKQHTTERKGEGDEIDVPSDVELFDATISTIRVVQKLKRKVKRRRSQKKQQAMAALQQNDLKLDVGRIHTQELERFDLTERTRAANAEIEQVRQDELLTARKRGFRSSHSSAAVALSQKHSRSEMTLEEGFQDELEAQRSMVAQRKMDRVAKRMSRGISTPSRARPPAPSDHRLNRSQSFHQGRSSSLVVLREEEED